MRKLVVTLLALGVIAAPAAAIDADNNGVAGDEPTYSPGSYEGDTTRDGHAVVFPTLPADTWDVFYYPYWWNAGDTAYGTHDVDMGSVDQADVTIYLTYNSLVSGCGFVEMDFRIDGTTVGSFTISAEDGFGPINHSFDFAPVSPPFELRYYVTNTVASGCGSISLDESGLNMVEFGGSGTPVETASWSAVKSFYR